MAAGNIGLSESVSMAIGGMVGGGIFAALAVFGSLNAISSFASLAFITIFGAISALAFSQRESWTTTVIPAAGAIGATAAASALLYHPFTAERGVFVTVLALGAAVVAVELPYFKREPIERGIADLEDAA